MKWAKIDENGQKRLKRAKSMKMDKINEIGQNQLNGQNRCKWAKSMKMGKNR